MQMSRTSSSGAPALLVLGQLLLAELGVGGGHDGLGVVAGVVRGDPEELPGAGAGRPVATPAGSSRSFGDGCNDGAIENTVDGGAARRQETRVRGSAGTVLALGVIDQPSSSQPGLWPLAVSDS